MSEPTLMIFTPRRGRRPRATVAATERIEIVVTKAERSGLERIAATERKTLSAVIREAVNEFVGDFSEEKPFSSGKNSRPT
jgi:hypothetical protein